MKDNAAERFIALNADYQQLQSQAASIDPSDKTAVAAIHDTLDGLDGQIQAQAAEILNLANDADGSIAALDAEIKRLQERRRVAKDRADGLRQFLKDGMAASGISKIECPLFSITLAKPRDQVEIFDADALPDELVDVKTTFVPDKKAILEALKAGEDVPGARLVDGARNLIIK